MATTRRALSMDVPAPISESNDTAIGSGVSWPAVFAGAFAMGALSLILMVLGAGVGLSSVSPWPEGVANASRISFWAVIWLIFVQLVASAIGGYLAGRLRTKWTSLHTHEVYFRDTAHGFIAWAVALVISTLLFASYATSFAGSRVAANNDPNSYFADLMFRTDYPAASATDPAAHNEAALVLANATRRRGITNEDQSFLAGLVSSATGLGQADAERRVTDTVAADLEAADVARRAVAHSFYWLFAAFLIGAFSASFAATIGGRQRDNVPAVR